MKVKNSHNRTSPNSHPALGLTCLCLLAANPPLHAQFNPIGFEGATISGIPYATNVGIPNGTPANTAFSYTFVDGNNLQSFRNASAGIVDSDDGSGGGSAVPDYYKSPEFGWRIDGWQTTDNTAANWDVFNNAYVGNGASIGEDYPGGVAGRRSELSEAININRNFSPAAGNLAKAQGLGDFFLDTHGSSGNTSQIALDFQVNQVDNFFITMAFGGRDAGSQATRSYFRLLENGVSIFNGSTQDTPYEAWTPIDTNNPSAGAVRTETPASIGVTQKDWEYFKNTFAVTPGNNYTLQVLLPEEINFDLAIGAQYSYTPGIITDFSAVPEVSAYGLAGLACATGFAFLRRRPRPAAIAPSA